MINKSDAKTCRFSVPLVAILSLCFVPSVAFAQEQSVDSSILVPKMSEFVPALIAFLIIWFVFAKLLWPKVLANLDAREQKIQSDIDMAEKSRLDSEAELEQYRAKLEGAQQEADEIIVAAKRSAEESSEHIKAKAQQEASQIVARAREAAEIERKRAMIDVANTIAGLSCDVASKILQENLDEEKQRELIDKYLTEVGTFDER